MTDGWLVVTWRPDREDLIIGEAVVRVQHKAKRRMKLAIKAPKDVRIYLRRNDD